RIVEAVPARHARRRLDAVRSRLFGAAFQVMERRGEGCRGYSDIQRHSWTPPMLGSLSVAFSLSASRSDRIETSRGSTTPCHRAGVNRDYRIDQWRKLI